MVARTKAKKGNERVSLKELELPPSVIGCLCRNQVCKGLGGISLRKLSMMISTGEFPKCDMKIGDSPRWTVATFNEWIEARRQDYPSRKQ